MTYYRVDFSAAGKAQRAPKRFRTEEQAKKHARKVLGISDDVDMKSKVNIVAVDRTGTVI